MQTGSRLFDDLAKMASSAAGVAAGARREIETLVRERMQHLLDGMDLVRREEFDIVRDMAEKARLEQEKLAARIAELEAAITARDIPPGAEPTALVPTIDVKPDESST